MTHTPTAPRPHDAEVLIVGAGPAGLALACALADVGLRCLVLEQQSAASLQHPPEDGRDIALTHRARRILVQLGLWDRLPASEIAPLRRAQVTNGDSPRVLPFEAHTEGHEQLGWLVPNHRIREACHAGVLARGDAIRLLGDARVTALTRTGGQACVTLSDGRSFGAPLVVAADSRFSGMRRLAGIGARSLDFGRTAIVCRMAHELPHDGTAHECFLHGHTLAMLPMAGQESSVVWTVASDGAEALMALENHAFAAAVDSAFGHRLGALRQTGTRHAYPLVAVYAQRFCADRFALVGDAAVGMHPVTAHGYNFGLYGIEVLAKELAHAHRAGRDLGDSRALQRYAAAHQRTTLPIYLGTNGIVQLFTNDSGSARLLREAVVGLTNHLPPIKAAVTRQLTGDAGSRQTGLSQRLAGLQALMAQMPRPPLPAWLPAALPSWARRTPLAGWMKPKGPNAG